MKQFNLDEYLKNPNRKIITRDGRNVRIVCTNRRGLNVKPIAALITIPNGDEIIKTYWENGVCYLCPYYDNFRNFCGFYKIFLNGPGFESTCNNIERVIDEE